MKALVTGGSGFIGRRLVERLQQDGAAVRALVRPGGPARPLPRGVEPVEADLVNADAVRAALQQVEPTIVFHCAMSSGHPSNAAERLEGLRTAVSGTANMAEASAEAGVQRFVHLGSFLGYRPQSRAIREDDPIEPSSSRGAAKAAASIWLRQFATAMEFQAVELRVFSVYGPGESAHRFIPVVLRAALDGSRVPLRPGVSRDLVYVDDVVEACLAAAFKPLPPGAVFNVAGGRRITNEEVIAAAREVTGLPIRVETGAYPGKAADGSWLADISLAEAQLGWAPKRSLHEGLREAYRCLA